MSDEPQKRGIFRLTRIATSGYNKGNRVPNGPGIAAVSVLALLALIVGGIAASGLTNVDSTERAVVFHTDGSLTVLQPGKMQYVTPIFSSVTKYDVSESIYTETAVGLLSDNQETSTEVTVRYQPDPSAVRAIHQSIRKDYEPKVILPAVQGCTKDAVAFATIDNLTGTARAAVNQNIRDCITAALARGHILAIEITITDFDFSDQVNAANERKAVAKQAAEEALFRQQQAKADADTTRILAQAQADAARLLAQSTTGQQGEAYLFLEWLKVWDGKLPTVMTDGDSSLLVTPPAQS